MRISQQPAFVLHARPWRETSLLLELFTHDHGRVGAVARGVRGARKQSLRAALQPLAPLRVDYSQRGELAQLVSAEQNAPGPRLTGDRLLAAIYLNELLLRLLPRNDPAPALFERYVGALTDLSSSVHLAWSLRRFERDLLELLGFAPPWNHDAQGQPVRAAQRYRLDAEHGPQPISTGGVPGSVLLALVADRMPDGSGLRELRDALREVIRHHLGGRDMRSWGLLAQLPH